MASFANAADANNISQQKGVDERQHMQKIQQHQKQKRGKESGNGIEQALRRGRIPSTPACDDTFENMTTAFVAETKLPSKHGFLRVRAYRCVPKEESSIDLDFKVQRGVTLEPIALLPEKSSAAAAVSTDGVPVRVHDMCLTSEVFGSLKCDCAEQLEFAINYIQSAGNGVVIYMQQEGRGIGLANKIAAYAKQEQGYDTVDANRVLGLPDDARIYWPVKAILDDLGIKKIRLMTNNPRKLEWMERLGIAVAGRIPVVIPPGLHSQKYLHCKSTRMQHLLPIDGVTHQQNGFAAQRKAKVEKNKDNGKQ